MDFLDMEAKMIVGGYLAMRNNVKNISYCDCGSSVCIIKMKAHSRILVKRLLMQSIVRTLSYNEKSFSAYYIDSFVNGKV